MSAPGKIGFVSLGCPKALVDSEQILSRLRAEGYEISASYDGADLVVVNTCGFIDAAVQESLEAIGEALEENGRVIVTGCLGARKETVEAAYPGLLAVTGPHAAQEVVATIHSQLPPQHDPYLDLLPPGGIKLTPRHYAYLKIAEGCNHRCSFCIIPQLRGDLVSRPVCDVLREAEALAGAGVRELLVVSQDTAAYGSDRKYAAELCGPRSLRAHIVDLAQALGQLGIWIRLHYIYPYPVVDELLPLMAEGAILPYLDIPFQHANSRLLKKMRRPASSERQLRRLENWRQSCPDLTLRSTFIVGFPGETDSDFEELLEFLRAAQLDRVGAFAYSPVEGAAANRLPDAVPEALKQERLERFMALQAEISAGRLAQKIGRTLTVLVDRIDPEGVVARSAGDAPEIDGQVFVAGVGAKIAPGDVIEVTITDADPHDLWAVAGAG